jgi:predicted RNase H-like nuclease (RuvC/YqgF family)
MAIDLSQVEPLSSKSLLLEQALKRQQMQNGRSGLGQSMESLGMEDMLDPDYEWLKEDKSAIENLVKQMDASIGQLAQQLRQVDKQSRDARNLMDKEQKLLFKQIKTLNGLLKKQIDLFSAMEKQMKNIEIEQSNVMPQIGIGLVSGLIAAATVVATMPWISMLTQKLLNL